MSNELPKWAKPDDGMKWKKGNYRGVSGWFWGETGNGFDCKRDWRWRGYRVRWNAEPDGGFIGGHWTVYFYGKDKTKKRGEK